MKRTLKMALALLVGFSLIGEGLAQGADAGTVMGTVASVFRRVEVLPLGKGATWKPLEKGDTVRVADWIRTGPRGRARIEFADRFRQGNAGPSVVNIASRSELRLEKFLPRLKRPAKTEGVIGLLRGAIRTFTKNWGSGSAFSVRVGTSLCGIRGSEVIVSSDIPSAAPLGGAPFQGSGPWDQGRPATMSCLSGDCFAFPQPQGGLGGVPGPSAPQVRGVDPGLQLVMGNSNDPDTWRLVPLSTQRRQELLEETGVPGVSQGKTEDSLFDERFGAGGGGRGTGPSLPPTQLGGLPSPHGGAGSNRFLNHGVVGSGTLSPGSSFHDMEDDIDTSGDFTHPVAVDDDDSPRALEDDVDMVGEGELLFADGFRLPEDAAGWSGSVSELTQYQAGLRTLRQLGQSIVDGNLKAFMDSFSPNATQDTTIFRNGFLDDLQEDQNSTINLDFEVFEYRLAGTAWNGGTLIVRLRWLLTINGSQVITGTARILFDRVSGYRIISWLGEVPFGRNDSATQQQAAAGDPNVSIGPIEGSGSAGLLYTLSAATHQTVLVLDFETGSEQVFTGPGSLPSPPSTRENNINSSASSNADFAVDVQSAPSGFVTVGNMNWITAGLRTNNIGMWDCSGNPTVDSIGSVNETITFNNRDILPFPFSGTSPRNTFAFRTEEGRYGVVSFQVTQPSAPGQNAVISYQYKVAREPNTTTIDESASGVCNH